MTNAELGTEIQWSLKPLFGFEHQLLIVNAQTIIYTWIMIVLLILLLLLFRFILKRNNKIARFVVLSLAESLMNMVTQALGTFSFKHFTFIGAIFFFILLGNTLSIIPWLEEPTKDLNTTLALGIISFVYVQYAAIKHGGIIEYIKEFFTPFFLMFPINVVGKLASVVSISLRLFGNIFGGSIITGMYFSAIKGSIILETISMVVGLNLIITLFFSLFEGFLQAFVFTMLSLTYLSIALQQEGH